MAEIPFLQYYRVGNGLLKYDGHLCYYVLPEGEWMGSGEITLRFLLDDLSSDPELINEVEAAAIFKRLTGKVMP